jgi:Tfp pilus assembly protein PilF
MSVIGNALKAAQREKQRRTAGGGGTPLIVPLRTRAASRGFSWTRALALGIGGAAVFGATAVGVKYLQRDSRPAAVFPPTIFGDAAATPAADSTRPRADSTPRVASATPAAPQRSKAAPRATSRAGEGAPVRRTATAATASAPSATAASREPAPAQQSAADSSGRLRIAVDEPREDAARLFAAAVSAHRAGDLAYARVAYERVLAMVPGDVDAMNNLGILLSTQRELDRAERLLRRATTLAPRNADVWNNLGTVLRERGQSADAIAAFQHALAIDPSHQGARVSLAQQFMAINAHDRARELLEQVVAANPAVPEAQYALGQVLERLGDRAGAIRAYQAFVRVAPARFATHVEFVKRRVETLSSP